MGKSYPRFGGKLSTKKAKLPTKKLDLTTVSGRAAYTMFQLRTEESYPRFSKKLSTPSASYDDDGTYIYTGTRSTREGTIIIEEKEHIERLKQLIRLFDIENPGVFLERWSRPDIYTALDQICGLEKGGLVIKSYAGFLWRLIEQIEKKEVM